MRAPWSHAPQTYLAEKRVSSVDDWSWAQTMRRVGLLARLAGPYRRRVVLAAVSLLVATATALAPPFLAGLAIDRGIADGDLEALGWIVAAFLAAAILNWGASTAQTYTTGWVGERILADLRGRVFAHLQRLSLGFYERNRAGAIISRLTNDVEALDQLVTDGATSLVQNSLMLVGTAIILFVLDWRLALATLAVFPLMSIATRMFRRRSTQAYKQVRERLSHVTATLQEGISGMREVQAFERQSRNLDEFRDVNGAYRDANYATVVLNGLYFPFVDFLSAAATAVVLGYGGYLVFGGSLTVGALFAFIGYLANFFDPVQQLSQLYNTFLAAVAALDKITDVLEEEPEVVDRPNAVELPRIEGDVRFEGVRFAYGRGPEVLHGIDLDVPAGTTVALVGHTGAGKSTIAKLLARFYDPTEGRIIVDGYDLRDVTQRSLRTQLGVVPQEGFLFAGTVRDNIAFGRARSRRGRGRGGCGGGRRARLHHVARARLRHRGRRAREPAVARPAPARRVRPSPPGRPAHPHPRRGDLECRHRHRTTDRAGARPSVRKPHRVHHRASAVDDHERRRDRGARARTGARARLARRARRPRRRLPRALRRLGGGGRLISCRPEAGRSAA